MKKVWSTRMPKPGSPLPEEALKVKDEHRINYDAILKNVLDWEERFPDTNRGIYREIFQSAIDSRDSVLEDYMAALDDSLQERLADLSDHLDANFLDLILGDDLPRLKEAIKAADDFDIHKKDGNGLMLINHAVMNGSVECAKYLLKEGAREDVELKQVTLKDAFLHRIAYAVYTAMGLSGAAIAGGIMFLGGAAPFGIFIAALTLFCVGGMTGLASTREFYVQLIKPYWQKEKIIANTGQSIFFNLFDSNLDYNKQKKMYETLFEHRLDSKGTRRVFTHISAFDPKVIRLRSKVLDFQGKYTRDSDNLYRRNNRIPYYLRPTPISTDILYPWGELMTTYRSF